nr:MAG TPA: hypothetical protein [Caudoviricetes sp.]
MKLRNLIKLAEIKKELEMVIQDEKENEAYDSNNELYLECASNDLETLIRKGVVEYENK